MAVASSAVSRIDIPGMRTVPSGFFGLPALATKIITVLRK
jgi:hypothetical protein